MQTKVSITKKLGVPAQQAWAAVAAIGRLDVWFPSLSGCRVEGTGAGATRTMTLEGGLGEMVDRILEVDPDRRRLRYHRIESPFPVAEYLGTVEVFESYDGRAVVCWTVDLEAEQAEGEATAALLRDGIGAGVDGMDADLSGRSSG